MTELTPGQDYVGTGLDLEVGTLLGAYARGWFPMPSRFPGESVDWFCPDPRGVLPLDRAHLSRSTARSARGFTVTVDRAFDAVVAGCGDERRPDGWITAEIADAYAELHRSGFAHSVEVWSGDLLAGGLYGVAIGGLFAGESMFHRVSDASQVAVLATAALLDDGSGQRLFDVQWTSDHLASLGVVEVPREAYLARLGAALDEPSPDWAAGPPRGWVERLRQRSRRTR